MEYADVLRAIQSLKENPQFVLYTDFMRAMLESKRCELETSDQQFRQMQGQVACLRELLNHIDNAQELCRVIGQSAEQADPQ